MPLPYEEERARWIGWTASEGSPGGERRAAANTRADSGLMPYVNSLNPHDCIFQSGVRALLVIPKIILDRTGQTFSVAI